MHQVGTDKENEDPEVMQEKHTEQYSYIIEKSYEKYLASLLDGKFEIRRDKRNMSFYELISEIEELIEERKPIQASELALSYYTIIGNDLVLIKQGIRDIVKELEKELIGFKKANSILIKQKEQLLSEINAIKESNNALITKYAVLEEKFKHKEVNKEQHTEVVEPEENDFEDWDELLLKKFRERRDLKIKGQLKSKSGKEQKIFPRSSTQALRLTSKYKKLRELGKDPNKLALESYNRVVAKLLKIGELSDGDYDI